MSELNSAVRILVIDCRIDLAEAFSLKDKRRVRQRLSERLRQRFNLSVAETGSQDLVQILDLTIAYVARNETAACRMRDQLNEVIADLLQGSGELREWIWDLY